MDKVLRYVILLKYLLRKFSKRGSDNTLIIIKIEAIGDYLLFRNFLKTIRESKKYNGYKITLLGNVLWKDFAIEFDSEYVDEFIWIKPLDLNNVGKAKKIFDEVSSKRYKELITFHYSRSIATDILSLVVVAREKVTMHGDSLNLKPTIKNFTDRIYSKIINVPASVVHEFQRNCCFAAEVTGENVEIDKPQLCIKHSPYDTSPYSSGGYILVAPGAGVKNRQISKTTLQKIIAFLLSNNIRLCFVGAPGEAEYVNALIAPFTSELITNLTGKTSLVELAYLTEKAKAVLCHDSSAYHLAVSLNKKTFCFAGGGHFNRFVEYPNVEDVYLLYHKMACFNCDWKCIFKFENSDPYPCLSKLEYLNIEGIISKHLLVK